MEKITVTQVIRICDRYYDKLGDFIDIYTKYVHFLRSRRSRPVTARSKLYDFTPLEEIHNELMKKLEKILRMLMSVNIIIEIFVEKFQNRPSVTTFSEMNSLQKFIDEISILLNSRRSVLLDYTKQMYYLETERAQIFSGYLSTMQAFELAPCEYENDVALHDNIAFLFSKYFNWTQMITLFMDQDMFDLLVIPYFFDVTDALSIVYWQTYQEVDQNVLSAHPYYEYILNTVANLGFPGSNKLLLAGLDSNEDFDVKNGVTTAYEIARFIEEEGKPSSPYFDQQDYLRVIERFLNELMPRVLDLYINMRRSLSYYLRWFFGEELLLRKVTEALKRPVGLDFYKCQEFFLRTINLCRIMDNTLEKPDLAHWQHECITTVKDISTEADQLEAAFKRDMNRCLGEMVIDYFEICNLTAKQDYGCFAVRATHIMSLLGYIMGSLPRSAHEKFMDLFAHYSEFIRVTDAIIEESKQNPEEIIRIKGYQERLTDLFNMEKNMLFTLNNLPRNTNQRTGFGSVWMGLPLTIEIRAMAQQLSEVDESKYGWCPNPNVEWITKPLKKEAKRLVLLTPTDQKEDKYLSDVAFRKLLPAEQERDIVNSYKCRQK